MVKRGTLVKPAVSISQHQISNQRCVNCTACLIKNMNPCNKTGCNDEQHQYHRCSKASVMLIYESKFHQIWPKQKPDVTKADVIRTYTGENVPLLGTVKTTIKYPDQTTTLLVLIVKGQGPNIIGSDST